MADLDEVCGLLWKSAAFPVSRWPEPHRRAAESNGRVDDDGLVHLVKHPEDILVIVCGGLSNLHAFGLPTFGPTRATTRPVVLPD
jgi:hypothetical protein